MESFIVKHIQCPQCRKEGRDNGHDNLGVYSDGHQFCFSCGYFVPTDKCKTYMARYSGVQTPIQRERDVLRLPTDCDAGIPRKATDWFFQYGFDNNALTRYNILWSEHRQFLVFPYFIDGELVAWQGRYFGEDKKIGKWHTKGKVEEIIYTLGPKSKSLVLVEDIVSAMKLSRIIQSSPLFGSVISLKRLTMLRHFYDTLYIWLDPDKQKEAIQFAQRGRLFGFDCHVILSDKDPKEHTTEELEQYINAKTRGSPS